MGRKDGKLVKDISGLQNILFDLKPKRCDSDVYINLKVNATKLVEFVDKHKNDGENKLTFFHAFVYAFAKVFYEKPNLNRFVVNRSLYDRNNVVIAFVAKVAFDDKSEEVMINIDCDKKDTVYTLRDKISNKVSRVRNNKSNKKDNTNNIVDVVGKLPKFLRVPIVGMYKWIDKKGMLPLSMMEDNIYYSSAIISNLGNFHIESIYHNLTDFGTSSIIITVGEIHKEKILNKLGKEEICDVCDFGINCDERISDGFYFASAAKIFQYILENPSLLEGALDERIKLEKEK